MQKLKVALLAGALFMLFFTLLKGGETMVAIYVALIIYGRRTIDTVPQPLREAVLADLAALGLDGYGKALPPEEALAQ